MLEKSASISSSGEFEYLLRNSFSSNELTLCSLWWAGFMRTWSLPRPPHGSSIPCRGWADGVSTGRLWGAGEICAKSTLIWVFLVWQTGSRRTSGKSGGQECSDCVSRR